jgi:parvulin-like peptidyl-prolyl isomerase
MKNSHLPIILLACAALFATACHPAVKDPKDPKFIVAEKGDWQVLRSQLDSEIANYLKQSNVTAEQVGPEKMPMLETMILDSIVFKKLALDKAAALQLNPDDVAKEEAADLGQLQGADTDDQFQQKLKAANLTLDDLKKRIHEKVLITRLLEAEAFKNTEPSEEEIDSIYLQNKDRFVIPPKVRASRVLILVDDKATPADKAAKKDAIDKAHDRVMHGEDFAKVATAVSEDRYSAPKGGDIGYFQRGESESPGFDDVAFNTKVGVVSPVFETPLGYQFIKVTDIQPGGPVPLADVRSFIADKLRQRNMQQQEQAYSKKLIADSGVVFHVTMVDLSAPPPPASPAPAPADPNAPAPDASASGAPDQTPSAAPASAAAPDSTPAQAPADPNAPAPH